MRKKFSTLGFATLILITVSFAPSVFGQTVAPDEPLTAQELTIAQQMGLACATVTRPTRGACAAEFNEDFDGNVEKAQDAGVYTTPETKQLAAAILKNDARTLVAAIESDDQDTIATAVAQLLKNPALQQVLLKTAGIKQEEVKAVQTLVTAATKIGKADLLQGCAQGTVEEDICAALTKTIVAGNREAVQTVLGEERFVRIREAEQQLQGVELIKSGQGPEPCKTVRSEEECGRIMAETVVSGGDLTPFRNFAGYFGMSPAEFDLMVAGMKQNQNFFRRQFEKTSIIPTGGEDPGFDGNIGRMTVECVEFFRRQGQEKSSEECRGLVSHGAEDKMPPRIIVDGFEKMTPDQRRAACINSKQKYEKLSSEQAEKECARVLNSEPPIPPHNPECPAISPLPLPRPDCYYIGGFFTVKGKNGKSIECSAPQIKCPEEKPPGPICKKAFLGCPKGTQPAVDPASSPSCPDSVCFKAETNTCYREGAPDTSPQYKIICPAGTDNTQPPICPAVMPRQCEVGEEPETQIYGRCGVPCIKRYGSNITFPITFSSGSIANNMKEASIICRSMSPGSGGPEDQRYKDDKKTCLILGLQWGGGEQTSGSCTVAEKEAFKKAGFVAEGFGTEGCHYMSGVAYSGGMMACLAGGGEVKSDRVSCPELSGGITPIIGPSSCPAAVLASLNNNPGCHRMDFPPGNTMLATHLGAYMTDMMSQYVLIKKDGSPDSVVRNCNTAGERIAMCTGTSTGQTGTCPSGQFRNPTSNVCESSVCTSAEACEANRCDDPAVKNIRGWDPWCRDFVKPLTTSPKCPNFAVVAKTSSGEEYCSWSGKCAATYRYDVGDYSTTNRWCYTPPTVTTQPVQPIPPDACSFAIGIGWHFNGTNTDCLSSDNGYYAPLAGPASAAQRCTGPNTPVGGCVLVTYTQPPTGGSGTTSGTCSYESKRTACTIEGGTVTTQSNVEGCLKNGAFGAFTCGYSGGTTYTGSNCDWQTQYWNSAANRCDPKSSSGNTYSDECGKKYESGGWHQMSDRNPAQDICFSFDMNTCKNFLTGEGVTCPSFSGTSYTDPAAGCTLTGGVWTNNTCQPPINCPSPQWYDWPSRTCKGSTAYAPRQSFLANIINSFTNLFRRP